MEGSGLPGGFRPGFFDDPVAFGRISSGGISLMKKSVLSAMVVLLLLGAAAYAAFCVAPTDAKQGVVYRILYLHVASAWTGLTSFFICFIANLLYVFRRQPRWDWLGVSAGETGLVFTTVVLLTGPIWAHPVWGIWWTWDARLTSTFVLWLLYVSYLLLRTLVEEPDRRALLSALFGIFAFIDVPLVFGSIRWWRTQHPQPVVMGAPGWRACAVISRLSSVNWRQHEKSRQRFRGIYGWLDRFLCLLHKRGAAHRGAARGRRTPEKFIATGQVAWQGRRKSELCCFSSAGRIRWRPSSRFC